MQVNRFRVILLSILLLSLIGFAPLSFANSGGKEASAGGGNTAKLEPFIVNLSSTERYLQIAVTLKLASAEVAEQVKTYMPLVRHGLILILSSKDDSQIQSAEGKRELMNEIREKLNKTLKVTEHDGVTDIFFENFVIQ
jgi:flagellar protein FliL